MAISDEFNEISDPGLNERLETVIRTCIGDRPSDENWKMFVHSGTTYSCIVVTGPTPKREQLFVGERHALPEKVRDWLESYPFR